MKQNFMEQVYALVNTAIERSESAAALGRAVGVNKSNLSNWSQKKSAPSTAQLAPIADLVGAQIVLPGETPDLRTFARMLALEAEDAPAHHMERGLDSTTPESVLEYVAAKRHHQPDMLFHPNYLTKLGLDAADGILYRVPNDALHPAVSRGDQVLVDRTQTSIEDGALYLFHLGPSFALRYAARELGRVILYTTSSVPSQSLTPEQEQEIKILGRVVWVGKKL